MCTMFNTTFVREWIRGTMQYHISSEINLLGTMSIPKNNLSRIQDIKFHDNEIILEEISECLRKEIEKYNTILNHNPNEKRLLVGFDYCMHFENNRNKNYLHTSLKINYSRFRGKSLSEKDIDKFVNKYIDFIKTAIDNSKHIKDKGITYK